MSASPPFKRDVDAPLVGFGVETDARVEQREQHVEGIACMTLNGTMLGLAACHGELGFRELTRAALYADLAGSEIDAAVIEAMGSVAAELRAAADAYGHAEVERRLRARRST